MRTIDEIVADLHSYVAGRGRKNNFMFSNVYSPASGIFSVDFSRWIGRCLITQDTLSLAVFRALYEGYASFTLEVSFEVSDDGEIEIIDEELEKTKKRNKSFKREVNRCKRYNQKILDFPFERYYADGIGTAKIDLLTAWLLGYKEKTFSRIMMAHRIEFKNAGNLLKKYNDRKNKHFELPEPLTYDSEFQEFQRELGKLPLASRLHVFDVLEFTGYGKKTLKRHLSDMTMYDTRAVGIDENESADILRQSILITSFPNGSGSIAPEYIEPVSIALDYAKKLEPVYYQWKSEIGEIISNKTSVYFYDNNDPSKDGYYDVED